MCHQRSYNILSSHHHNGIATYYYDLKYCSRRANRIQIMYKIVKTVFPTQYSALSFSTQWRGSLCPEVEHR